MLDYLKQNILQVAASRMAARAQLHLNVSLQRSVFKQSISEHELRELIRSEADKEALKAN